LALLMTASASGVVTVSFLSDMLFAYLWIGRMIAGHEK